MNSHKQGENPRSFSFSVHCFPRSTVHRRPSVAASASEWISDCPTVYRPTVHRPPPSPATARSKSVSTTATTSSSKNWYRIKTFRAAARRRAVCCRFPL